MTGWWWRWAIPDKAKQPIVLVIGGPNGAGKSTCAEAILGEKLQLLHFVNADTIARGMSGFSPESVVLPAGRLMLDRLHELSSRRADFAFETTLAGRTHIRFLERLKSVGYRVELLYICLAQPDLCVKRIADRVAQGGHHVPEIDVRRRFRRSAANLFNFYLPLADRWLIVDNSAETPELVARYDTGTKLHVADQDRYDDLREQAKSS